MRRRHVLGGIAGTAAVAGAAGVLGVARVLDGGDGGGDDGEGGTYGPLGHVDVEGARELVVDEAGTTAYLAVDDGIATVDVSDPAAPSVLAERRDLLVDHAGGPLGLVWDVSVAGDRLLAVGPAQSRPVGGLNAAMLFDVADPAAPSLLDAQVTSFAIHNCCLADGTAYLTNNDEPGNPLVVYSTDGDAFAEIARWSLLDQEPAWGTAHRSLRQLHDVTVRGDVAYLPYWDAGTYLLDVSDPSAPSYLGHTAVYEPADVEATGALGGAREALQPPGNSHYVGVDGDVMAVGREAWAMQNGDCVTGGPAGIDFYDVGDPSAIERLARIDPPESYSNRQTGWFTTAHNFELTDDRLYSAWYFGGVKLHDVSDPADPVELAWWRQPTETAFWTAQRSAGEAFVASSADDAAGYGDGIPGRVYTFPERAGSQPTPPSLTDPPEGSVAWEDC